MATDMDIFMDMMSDQDTPFCETVESGKPNSYYQGLGILQGQYQLAKASNNDHGIAILQAYKNPNLLGIFQFYFALN